MFLFMFSEFSRAKYVTWSRVIITCNDICEYCSQKFLKCDASFEIVTEYIEYRRKRDDQFCSKFIAISVIMYFPDVWCSALLDSMNARSKLLTEDRGKTSTRPHWWISTIRINVRGRDFRGFSFAVVPPPLEQMLCMHTQRYLEGSLFTTNVIKMYICSFLRSRAWCDSGDWTHRQRVHLRGRR